MGDLISLEGKKLASSKKTTDGTNPNEPPPPSSFEFFLKNGDSFIEEGYIMATGAFVAIGQAEGQMTAVVPLDELHFVRQCEAVYDEETED